ncbi:DUF4062 domain-containing protein [Streptomyces atriruber]|uniref:DUF4062 domain-containing protein n=1 Tax=Streptomyces atriruber TaxID=545121 RepID=UPI0006E25328|nr:DUF4062 domain-containing protein [Streptomyces atriruber]
MKIFVSSARKGLEEERDALGGLITALGHTPVRFEDFSAQSTPSREACLRALATADVALFLLGPSYGHTFPETGQSATHDEWMAAQAAGMPRLVYRKTNVTFEPAQHAFARTVEAYATGVFRDSFASTAELLPKVTRKIKELEETDSPLDFAPLTHAVDLRWIHDEQSSSPWSGVSTPLLELHVLPVDFAGYSTRELEQLNSSLLGRIRRTGAVADSDALTASRSADHVAVDIDVPAHRPLWNSPQTGALRQVRLYKTGQLSARATLPSDGLGSILDRTALPAQITELLAFLGALNIVEQERIVVAAAVSDPSMTTVDTFAPHRSRSRAGLSINRSFILRTEPDESVTLAALTSGAEEVAGHVARTLIAQHPLS